MCHTLSLSSPPSPPDDHNEDGRTTHTPQRQHRPSGHIICYLRKRPRYARALLATIRGVRFCLFVHFQLHYHLLHSPVPCAHSIAAHTKPIEARSLVPLPLTLTLWLRVPHLRIMCGNTRTHSTHKHTHTCTYVVNKVLC